MYKEILAMFTFIGKLSVKMILSSLRALCASVFQKIKHRGTESTEQEIDRLGEQHRNIQRKETAKRRKGAKEQAAQQRGNKLKLVFTFSSNNKS